MLIFICIVISLGLIFSIIDRRISLAVIIIVGLSLRVIMSSDLFLHDWDERFHAVVAKNILSHPLMPTLYDVQLIKTDIGDWTKSHIWLSKPPLTFWITGTSLNLFGCNEFALRAPSILLSLLSVFLTYLIGLKLFNRKVGLLGSFFHSIHGLSLELNSGLISSDHVDTLFLFLFELGVYLIVLSINNKNVWIRIGVGIVMGLAYLTKWTMAFFIFFIWFVVYLINSRNISSTVYYAVIIVFGFLSIAFPWHLYLFNYFPIESKWMFGQLLTPITASIQGHEGGLFYYFNKIRIIFGELIYIIMIWAFVKYKELSTSSLNIILAWMFVPLVILSLAETKRVTYIMMSAPSYFILTSVLIEWIRNLKVEKRKYLKWISLILIIGLPVRYSLERIKPFKQRMVTPAWRHEMLALEKSTVGNKNIVLVNEPHYMDAMFYHDFIAYENALIESELDQIQEQGYTIYININGKYVLKE